MINKGFSQLTVADRIRKLNIAIRNRTDNKLSAEQIMALVQNIPPGRQYVIMVHPDNREDCHALVEQNVLHIYVPQHLYREERK